MHSNLSPVSKCLALSSLFFLSAGNFCGLMLAILLTYPDLNTFIEPYTYGKLIPVHLNFQLYGWNSLPLMGIIYFLYLREEDWLKKTSLLPILIWSISLIFGAFSWLNGEISGKIFLEWKDFSEYLFLFNLIFLWLFLSIKFCKETATKGLNLVHISKAVLLICLGFIPLIFYKAMDPHVFPPINKVSSGSTGSSLLLSTLVIVFIMLIFPLILQIEQKRKNAHIFPLYSLILHVLSCFFINLSDSSNYDIDQIIGLTSLVIWIPLLFRYYNSFQFRKPAFLWLLGALIWGTILVVSAVIMFLPKSLEMAKFSNILVAHVHLAMGGFVSALCMVILCSMPYGKGVGEILGHKNTYLIFQFGLLFYLISLLILGYLEHITSGVLYTYPGSPISSYLNPAIFIRLTSGILLLIAPLIWLWRIICLKTNIYNEH